MQSFILVRALWPNDISERSRADTVAPREITAIINPGKDSGLIRLSHKRRAGHKTRKHCQLASALCKRKASHHAENVGNEVVAGIGRSHKPAICHI